MQDGQFGNYHNDDSEDWGEEMLLERKRLDERLRNFVSKADFRRVKISRLVVGPSSVPGLSKRDLLTVEKEDELYRRFWKNKKWADYCQNRRYELAGLL